MQYCLSLDTHQLPTAFWSVTQKRPQMTTIAPIAPPFVPSFDNWRGPEKQAIHKQAKMKYATHHSTTPCLLNTVYENLVSLPPGG